MTTVEFLFDFGSPTTYLAHKRLPGLVERTRATVDYVPVLLGGLFKATGNASPAAVPAKGRLHEPRHGPLCRPPRHRPQAEPVLPDQHHQP